ncbi:acetyltransferase [Devosia sp. Root413D1]|uniref:GNAT family N-acetyltransferase n=1 Tax=unclassified Devosia TaxID=196773 RepID=UPI000701713E|nr:MULTISPECIES: GNAT family N-acetyltransferase [unclassified Devosia]KQV03206.1 acetyltransferase [Devosia sp. Root105]KQW78319.1 acetyltransferase [Devosia sp. Root413D1]
MHDITLLTVPVFSTLCNAAFALRREVFVIEQQIPEAEEFDADDLTATHLVAIAAGNVVGTLRIIWTPEHVKLGRVVVAQLWRGQGISTRLLRHAMALARDKGESRFYLTAQHDKLAVYEKLGFVAFGEPFDDGSGILHLKMRTY